MELKIKNEINTSLCIYITYFDQLNRNLKCVEMHWQQLIIWTMLNPWNIVQVYVIIIIIISHLSLKYEQKMNSIVYYHVIKHWSNVPPFKLVCVCVTCLSSNEQGSNLSASNRAMKTIQMWIHLTTFAFAFLSLSSCFYYFIILDLNVGS